MSIDPSIRRHGTWLTPRRPQEGTLQLRTVLGVSWWSAIGLVCLILSEHNGDHRATIMAAILLASLLSSIAGFAFSAICGAMLFHLGDDPVSVVQIMITCSIVNQIAMTWATRREIEWCKLSVYLAGGGLGLIIGIQVLLHADRAMYTRAIGAFLLLYGVYMFFRKPLVVRCQYPMFDLGAGFLGGITGGAVGFPGAAVTIWCSMKGWDKTRQRAMFQPFILIMQIAAFVGISLARRSGVGGVVYDIHDLLLIPASLAGTSLGLLLYGKLSDSQFARAVNILLIISGLSFVI